MPAKRFFGLTARPTDLNGHCWPDHLKRNLIHSVHEKHRLVKYGYCLGAKSGMLFKWVELNNKFEYNSLPAINKIYTTQNYTNEADN